MASNTMVPLLSPAEAEKLLPSVCLLVFQGVAQPVFPYGDRGGPSPVVLIVRVSPRSVSNLDASSVGLPFAVDYRQWKTAVVPVLEDESWWVSSPVVQATLGNQGLSQYLRLLGSALRQSFEDAGWGPVG